VTLHHTRAQNHDMISTGALREPIATLLEARPSGLGEAMLVHMVRTDDKPVPLTRLAPAYAITPDDPWVRKVRQTCRLLGAARSPEGVWSL
jgi:hypothetical protein